MGKFLFRMLGVVLALSLAFTPTVAFAVDYAAAGNPNAVAADPDAVVNLTDAGCIVTINDGVDLANAAGVTTAVNNDGKLDLAGSTTITGPVGVATTGILGELECSSGAAVLSSASFIKLVDVQGATTLAINGTLTSGTVAGTDGILFAAGGTGVVTVATGVNVAGVVDGTGGAVGTMTYAGTSTISSAIGSNQAIDDVNIDGGVVSVGANISATTIDIADTGTLSLSSSVTTVGTLALAAAADSNLDLNGSTLTHTGALTFGADSDLLVDVASSTSFGNAQVTGTVTMPNTVDVDVNVTGYLADGTALTVVNGSAGAGVVAPTNVTDNSAVLAFTASTDGSSQDLILTVSRSGTAYNDLASTGNGSAAGTALEAAGAAGPTGDMLVVLNTVDTLSATDIAASMDTMNPDVSAGVTAGSLAALNGSLGAVTSHLSGVRGGVSTGDGFEDATIWAKGFADFADQGTRKSIQGFEALTFGTTLGFDALAAEDVTLGISGGYAYTTVDPKQGNLGDTDINSYQGTLYGSYDGGPWYLDGAFGFAWNTYDASRRISLGTTTRIADADYDGQQYTGYLGAGYTIETDGFEITPMTSLQYTRLHIGDYTESGAGALNLKVNTQDYDVLESGLGAKIAYPVIEDGYTFIPEIHGMWLYDYYGDAARTTSSFAGGGGSFSTNGASPAQHSFDIGSQITFLTAADISVVLDYGVELKEDFYAHTGAVTVKYEF